MAGSFEDRLDAFNEQMKARGDSRAEEQEKEVREEAKARAILDARRARADAVRSRVLDDIAETFVRKVSIAAGPDLHSRSEDGSTGFVIELNPGDPQAAMKICVDVIPEASGRVAVHCRAEPDAPGGRMWSDTSGQPDDDPRLRDWFEKALIGYLEIYRQRQN